MPELKIEKREAECFGFLKNLFKKNSLSDYLPILDQSNTSWLRTLDIEWCFAILLGSSLCYLNARTTSCIIISVVNKTLVNMICDNFKNT